MTDGQPDGTREQRMREVLQAYLEAVDAGRAPAREELFAAHPDLAADLEAYFADQDRVDQLTAPLRPRSSGDGPLGTVRYIGDYELVEEIARGGMGVVYRARQVTV